MTAEVLDGVYVKSKKVAADCAKNMRIAFDVHVPAETIEPSQLIANLGGVIPVPILGSSIQARVCPLAVVPQPWIELVNSIFRLTEIFK